MTDQPSAAAFAADKQATLDRRAGLLNNGAAQVDANGRVRVATGWDAGEVIGKAGLDQTTGQVALAMNGAPAWHGLGTVVDGAMTAADALRLANLDWEVEKRPMFYGADEESRMGTGLAPNAFAMVRTDTDGYLGTVGRRYTGIQNEAGFAFLDDLTGQNGEARFETAGALEGGRKVFISMFLPENITLDPEGMADVVKPYFMAVNSHDGSGSFYVVVTPLRPVCANTVRWGLQGATAKWSAQHTSGAMKRMEEARRTLGLTIDYYKKFEQDATRMIQTPMSDREFDRLIESFYPLDDDASKVTASRVEIRRDTARYLFREADTNANIRNTVWGAGQALIEQIDWKSTIRPPKHMTEELVRGGRIIEGADDDKKSELHRRLLLLTR
jgi:phage/plasmid-like protein (TIGR03299 family)